MTSLASREMTEQEMVNTCTAPQMAHLIQVLRQTIRNNDKEIDRLVDMVSQLQRERGELDPPEPLLADAKVGDLCKTDLDEWIQIDDAPEPPSPSLYHFDRPFKGNIIHTEPLAPEGSAEWAWQMAKLGIGTKCSRGKIRISKSGMIEVCYNGMAYAMPMTQSPENRQYVINKMRECSPDGWQLYEPEPETEPKPAPAFKVGDWVEFNPGNNPKQVEIVEIDGDKLYYNTRYAGKTIKTHIYASAITRKLNPSEIVLEFGNGIKGTIRRYRGEQIRIYDGDINFACLAISYVTEPLQTTVRKLLKAQEEQ